MTKNGIDVSQHQGVIDWGTVKTDFVMLRAGWSWYAGGMDVDKQFYTNAAGAEKAGIPWGVYLYAYDKTPEAARTSARELARLLGGRRLSYPVAYDFEDKQYLQNSREKNTAITKAFLEEMESLGFYAMLYTYTNFAGGYLNMKDLRQYDFWVADYRAQLGYQGAFGMWQYSSSGRVDGIATVVDLNRAYKDYPAIIRGAGLNGFGEEAESGADPGSGEQAAGSQEDLEALREELAAARRRQEIAEEAQAAAEGRLAEMTGKIQAVIAGLEAMV